MFVDLLQDIIERRHLDTHLRQAQKMEAVGQLAGSIAHDFNNILMAMFGYIHLVKAAVSDRPDAFAHLEQLQHASERAAALVKQILTFSRQSEVQRQPVTLQTVIEEVLSLLRATLPSTIEIRTSIDPTCGMILADSTELHQVLMNLCTNATYAMREHGGVLELGLCPLTLDGSSDRDYVQCHVRDTGTGIPPAISKRIFEPFFTTKPVGEGTGMGLSVVHGIVHRNDGTIAVESTVGHGTTVVLRFPMLPPQLQEAVGAPAFEPLHGTEHLLFVDDEPTLVLMYEEMVTPYGYMVTTCTSGREAFALFREDPHCFDLVVTDHTMPQMTDAQLPQEILRIRPDIPIILCTGYSVPVSSDIAASIGIRDHVMKPIIVPELLRKIRKIFDNESGR